MVMNIRCRSRIQHLANGPHRRLDKAKQEKRNDEELFLSGSIDGRFAIRQGPWKLCLCAGSGGWSKGGGNDAPQLYDLATDPAESVNCASTHPEVVARLARLLDDYVTKGRSTPGSAQSNDVSVQVRSK